MATIGVKLELNSQQFAQGMKQATSEVKLLNTQLKGLTSSMASSGSAFSNHQRKTELLKSKLGALKNEQSLLNQKLTEAKAKWGENSAQANQYATKLERVNQDISSCEKELNAQGGTLGAVGAQFSAIGATLQTVGDKISQFGSTLTTKVTAPLALVGGYAAKNFAEVDKTMQLTNATMGNTEKEANLLSKAMKNAAANSTFGMTDAATATLNFARAGLSAEQAASALAPAMNLAAAEGGSLDTVSAGLVATINGFGGSFEEATNYADIFANACNNSALDIEGLSTSMSIAAPVFSAAGYSVRDAALYMGVMANAGISADVAANALKTGMARLVKPTKEAQTYLDKLGISVTNADGSMKDSVTIQKDLNQAFSGLSESEQIAAASAIFGKNQMSNWLALINTAPSEVDALSASLGNEGTTAAQAEAMMSGFGGAMEKLKSSIDVAATSLGESLAPMISKVSDKIQKAVDWYNSLDDKNKELIAKIAVVVAAIGPVLLIGGKIISFIGMIASSIGTILSVIGTITTAIGALNIAMSPMTITIIAIIAAIVALIAIGVLLYKNWDTIKAKCTEVINNIKKKFDEMKQKVTETITNIKESIANSAIGQLMGKVWGAAKDTVQEKLNNIKSAYNSHGGGLKGAVFATMEAIKSYHTLAFSFIDKLTGGKLSNMLGTVKTKLGEIKAKFSEIFGAIKEKVTNIFDGIKTNINNKLTAVKNIISGLLGAIKAIFNGDIESAKKWGKDMIDNFIAGIKEKIQAVKEAVTGVAKTVKDILGFSEPKKGPLSNFHTYGPDMMKLYSQGINDYSYLVKDAVSDVAADVSLLGSDGLSSDEIYNAVRSGSEDAEIGLAIGEREFTRVLRNLGVQFNA